MLFEVTPLMSILGMCAVYSLSLGEANMGQIMSSLDNGLSPARYQATTSVVGAD